MLEAADAHGVPVIGCSTHGELGPGGPTDGSVTVIALGGAGIAGVQTSRAQNDIQAQFDAAFVQCMFRRANVA